MCTFLHFNLLLYGAMMEQLLWKLFVFGILEFVLQLLGLSRGIILGITINPLFAWY